LFLLACRDEKERVELLRQFTDQRCPHKALVA
jgi:hypothetical protein